MLGGFARSISFDWKSHFSEFFKRLDQHKKITKMFFNGSGMQLSILDILPPSTNIKVLILNDSSDVNMIRSTDIVNSSQLKRPQSMRKRLKRSCCNEELVDKAVSSQRYKPNIWKHIEYLFIKDNNTQKYNIGLKNFPNTQY